MDENRPYAHVFYVKRDAVSTGKLRATGKIATLAVIAEHRNRGIRHSHIFTREDPGEEFKKLGLTRDGLACKEAGIPHVPATKGFNSDKNGTSSGKRSSLGHFN